MSTLLVVGSRGAAVRDLQTMLNAAGASPKLKTDGDFGGLTETAVRLFQERAGLVVDGRVGTQTLTALKRATAPVVPGRPEPDKSAMAGSAPASATLLDRASMPRRLPMSPAAYWSPTRS
ncbi:peptidoglycan hydrolase-like protein with peptidoglycan-binding domain [Rhizobium azooxidifex]|uniref:Peptidoglycan hydrolase-like protein with peptidoglycan-binding domain n=1 Tax=Mycoplana azooxidifex TaxID=1636188 RepID=A0A7W6DCB4_9HYPH|nr:peptidoglycan-binding domain-containing protein [Mycoplana azooxidifex]MBB3980077.1 peptidoglycan hydrolase-like protein with peptidoglycan-binding domain [Mycoplana azooxidifex]